MGSRKLRIAGKFKPIAILSASATVVALLVAFIALDGRLASEGLAAPNSITYNEPLDSVSELHAALQARLDQFDFGGIHAADLAKTLSDMDEAIATHQTDPRLWWVRGVVLTRLGRSGESQTARFLSIKYALLTPGGADLLAKYYSQDADECASEGDPASAAASFLAGLPFRFSAAGQFDFLERDSSARHIRLGSPPISSRSSSSNRNGLMAVG